MSNFGVKILFFFDTWFYEENGWVYSRESFFDLLDFCSLIPKGTEGLKSFLTVAELLSKNPLTLIRLASFLRWHQE